MNLILNQIKAEDKILLINLDTWGLLKISGEDRIRYLHNQSTNNFNIIQSGQSCDTVFINSTGRTIDLATAYLTEDAILILVSPNRRQYLLEWLDRFIFPFDKVELTDISTDYAVSILVGNEANLILEKLGIDTLIQRTSGNHQIVKIEDIELRIAVGTGLALPGYTLIMPRDQAEIITSKIAQLNVNLGTEIDWETLRILQGRPKPDTELTEDYNPLEAGLWHCISFDKGCYIGQETIARLNTYKGIKQRLWGIKLDRLVTPETTITIGEEKVGKLTSITETETGYFGLVYIRTKAGGEGLKVKLGKIEGE